VSPTVIIPFPRVHRQVELWNSVLAENLAERQGKDAVVLGWKGIPLSGSRVVGWSDAGIQISSVPRVLGARGTAPWSSVENEKCAATLPSTSGRSVSSSRYSSSAALARRHLIRKKQTIYHFILCYRRKVAMPAFPALKCMSNEYWPRVVDLGLPVMFPTRIPPPLDCSIVPHFQRSPAWNHVLARMIQPNHIHG